tara:strand:+ start:74 stop:484 length:411 start_codon:yes stop_codon:yes gene_type:complete
MKTKSKNKNKYKYKYKSFLEFLDEKKYFLIKQFFIGGITILCWSIIIHYGYPEVAGFLSGAAPIVFTYISISVILEEGIKTAEKTTLLALKGVLTWIIFAGTIYLFLINNLNIVSGYITATILWSLVVYIILKFKL